MTLPCDASRHSYPENRIGNYTTVLAMKVVLDLDYEVGLSECVIPVPRRSLNFTQPILYNEKGVTIGLGCFQVDASEINSLTDFQEIHLPRARKGEKVVFSVGPKNCDDSCTKL